MPSPFSFARIATVASLVAVIGVSATLLSHRTETTVLSPVQAAFAELQGEAARPPQIQMRNGVARFVDAEVDVIGATPVERARGYLRQYGALYGLTPSSTEELVWRRTTILSDEGSAVTFAQMSQGLPVFGAEITVYVRAGQVYSTIANLLPMTIVETAPSLTASMAIERARLLAGAVASTTYADPILEIYDPSVVDSATVSSSQPHLAWRVFLATADRQEVHLDARTGALLNKYANVMEHREALYDYDLDLEDANGIEATNGNGCYAYTSDDDWIGDEDGLLNAYHGDREAVSAWWAARNTYQFFHQTYGLHSYDNDGETVEAYIHAGGSVARGAASYNPGCDLFQFSNGNLGFDVFVHEFTHGIIAKSSGLVYANQSGALNESFADIMASVADGNWTFGEARTGGGQPFRDLVNPLRFGQPDTLPPRVIMVDNGGVHTNSGIQNKVANLISEGGVHNGQMVRGIGRAKLGSLMFETMRTLPSSAQFMDARNRIVSLADQWGRTRGNGFTTQDACSVRNAFYAAGYRGWDDVTHVDTDCDGVEDQRETDRDNDTIADTRDNCPGTANIDQTDGDGDGDGQGDACDFDEDGDTILDSIDNCRTIPNTDQALGYRQNPAQGNACEDFDEDGVQNPVDNCPLLANTDQRNTDTDRLGDACDGDDDNDTFPEDPTSNRHDNCPLVANPDQVDGDRDGVGDACDTCPNLSNADQRDLDRDGRGDVCDEDRDGDGQMNTVDPCPDAQVCIRAMGERTASFSVSSGRTMTVERFSLPAEVCPTCAGPLPVLSSSTCVGLTLQGAQASDRFWVSDEAGNLVARFIRSGGDQAVRFSVEGARKYVLTAQTPAGKTVGSHVVTLSPSTTICGEELIRAVRPAQSSRATTIIPEQIEAITHPVTSYIDLDGKMTPTEQTTKVDEEIIPETKTDPREKQDPVEPAPAPRDPETFPTPAPDALTQPPSVQDLEIDPATELFYGACRKDQPTHLRLSFTPTSIHPLTTLGVTYQVFVTDGASASPVRNIQLISLGGNRFGVDLDTSTFADEDLARGNGSLIFQIVLMDQAGLRATTTQRLDLTRCGTK